MSLVYDSGSSISNHTAMLYPSLFNMGTDESDVARTETDTRSDNKVRLENGETGYFQDTVTMNTDILTK